KLGAGQQRPDHLPAGIDRPILALGQITAQYLDLFFGRRPGKDIPHGHTNQLLFVLHSLEDTDELVVGFAQELLVYLVAVTEQQRLTDADLEVVVWLLDGRGQGTADRFHALDAFFEVGRLVQRGKSGRCGSRQPQRGGKLHRRQRTHGGNRE